MNPKNSVHTSFFKKIVFNPWKVIGVCLLSVVVIGSFMRNVAPSISYKDMLGADFPLLKIYERVQREYTNDDNLLVFIAAKNGNAFTKETLLGAKQLTKELWKTPYSIRVDSIANFQHTQADGDDLLVAELVGDPDTLDQPTIDRIRQIALAEPQLLNRAVNANGNTLAINVSFAFPNLSVEEKLSAESFVQEAVGQFRARYPQTDAHVAGLVALDATVMRISQKETGMFLMIVMLIVVGLLIWILRAFKPVIVSVFVIVFSIVAGMAFSGMMGWKLTPFTASVPMIILILAVADCVHYITGFLQYLRKGTEKKQALIDALKLNFQPIFITSITTAIGFLTLNFSESGSIRALGNQVAFGVMFAFAMSVTFLPAVLALLPIKSNPVKTESTASGFNEVSEFLFKYKASVLTISVILVGSLAYCLTLNELNDNIPTYFAKTLPWRQANDFGEKHFGGAYTFSYSLSSGKTDGVADPDFLKKVEAFATWLRDMPEAVYVNTITDTLKRINRSMHGDNQAYYRLPENRQLAAQYILLYEMSLPYGLDLNDQINLDKSATKVLITFKTLSTSQILDLEKKINRWLGENLPGITATGSGVQMMFAHLLDKDTRGLIWGAGIGLLIISFLLIFAFKSVKIGLISVVPNLFPAIAAFGIWGLLVGQVGMGMAMVSGMTIGIIVDDTVHFLYKYLNGRREKSLDAKEAVKYAYNNAGTSIIFTTVVLVSGFVAMAVLSEFRVNIDMGKMTAIILSLALLLDLVTLPALLMIADKEKEKEKAPLHNLAEFNS